MISMQSLTEPFWSLASHHCDHVAIICQYDTFQTQSLMFIYRQVTPYTLY